MTFLEALKKAREDPHVWFRPVSWRGFGMAYVVEPKSGWNSETIYIVPNSRGGRRAYFSKPFELLEDWEITTADVVNKENQ